MPYRFAKRVGNSPYYYVWNSGHTEKTIFRTEQDYRHFVARLSREDTGCKIISYCLTRNQYHLVLEELEPEGIARFVHKLNVAYAMYYNNKYEVKGKLFAGPYKEVSLPDLEDVAVVSAQLHRAPVYGGHGQDDYIWSSYRGYTRSSAKWLHRLPLTQYFKGAELPTAIRDYTSQFSAVPLPVKLHA